MKATEVAVAVLAEMTVTSLETVLVRATSAKFEESMRLVPVAVTVWVLAPERLI